MWGTPKNLAEHRAKVQADRKLQDMLEALVDGSGWGGAPVPLLYALGGSAERVVCVTIGDRKVAIALGDAADVDPADVWAVIQELTGIGLAS